jgi:hypothetical protein
MKPILTVLAFALAVIATPAVALAQNNRPQPPAQSPSQPPAKSEDEYKKKIEELEKKVADLQNRVKELMHQNDELRKAAGTGGGGGSSKPADRPAASSAPLSSPQAMFDALVKDYDSRFAAMPKESQTEQNRLMEAVRGWTREQARSMRGPAEWNIEVIDTRNPPGARAVEVTMQVLDRGGKPIGGPETVPIQLRFAKDMAKGKKYTSKATASAKPEYNAKRPAKGPKDEPRFIGAYAEFGFDLEVAEVKELTDSKP